MRTLYKFMIVLGFSFAVPSFYLFAQVGINTDNGAPDPSAMLDVKSTSKGVLLPRITKAQRDAIANPTNGLMVFCINCG